MHRVLVVLAFTIGVAHARPEEAIDTDRAAAASELRDLDRREASLEDQLGLRQRMLRRRLRALYKMAQGGSIRLLVDSDGPEHLAERLTAAQRVVARDLQELSSLDEELDELGRDRQQRSTELLNASKLEATRRDERPVGLERRRGDLSRPVPGPIVAGIGRVRVGDPQKSPALELPRRAADLAAGAGDPVRACASGTVRWVGEIEGIGHAVLVDHGEHYVSVTGRLGHISVSEGQQVRESSILGTAAGATISFELSEGRTALDPIHWLHPPIPPAVKPVSLQR